MLNENSRLKRQLDLTTRPLFRKIIIFALPLMLSSILQLLYNAADIIVLGHFASNESAGAVGSTGAIVNLMTTLFIGLSVGACSNAARCIGAGNFERLDKVVHTSICLALICGFTIGVIGIVSIKEILIWMNVPISVLPLSTLYLRIFFAGMPFNFLYNFSSALLRAQGDTKHPLLFLFLAGIVNICLNVFLVVVCHMDVAGVAIGTITAQALSSIMSVIYLIKQDGPCKIKISHLKIDKNALIQIIKIGLPAGLEGSIFAISNVIIQASVNSFGDMVLTANAEAGNLEGFIYVSMNSVSQACLTVVSQNYGAYKSKNIDVASFDSLIITTIIGLVLGLSCYFSCEYIMRIFTTSPEIIAIAKVRMSVISVTYCLCGIMEIPVVMMRGMGHSLTPMIVSLVGVCGVRILYIYTIFAKFRDLKVLYMSYPISWILSTIVLVICCIVIRKKEYSNIRRYNEELDKNK